MDFVPFDTVGLSLEGVDIFYKTYGALQAQFQLQVTGNINFHLEQFEVFKHSRNINIRGSFVIKQCDNDCYIFFIENTIKHVAINGHITENKEYQTWALAYLKHDFGRILIRRETLADKIIELVHPVEIDFAEDKAFSDTFYVLANDYNKTIAGIDRNFRNAIMDVRCDDFLIELVEHTLLIGSHKPILPEKAIHLAEFIERVASTC
jgi:hypothetical protein